MNKENDQAKFKSAFAIGSVKTICHSKLILHSTSILHSKTPLHRVSIECMHKKQNFCGNFAYEQHLNYTMRESEVQNCSRCKVNLHRGVYSRQDSIPL